MTPEEKQKREGLLARLFTPGTPISIRDLFAGRTNQIRKVLDAVVQLGQHAILYGERGVGKTSLANIIAAILTYRAEGDDRPPIFVTRVNCSRDDNFLSVWKKVLSHVSTTNATAGFGQENVRAQGHPFSSMLTDDSGPSDVAEIMRKIPGSVIILDEFDRIVDPKTTTLFADCIKAISDFEIPSTIVVVGVADSISGLIAEHASVERCITQVPLPRMSNDELVDIVIKRFPAAEMQFESSVPQTIARLSQGFPHYTHSLGLFSGRAALDGDRVIIDPDDVKAAVNSAVTNTTASIEEAYQKAVRSSHKDSLYEQVLLACSLAQPDEFGFFSAADVRKPMSAIMGKSYDIPAFAGHLTKFCEDSRDRILERKGKPRRYIYRFSNPLVRPYVYLRGIKNGTMPKEYGPI